jgi:hypothetical protein
MATRTEIHERHIERLEAELEEAQKRLSFARSWPLRTGYHDMVERQFPTKIQRLVDRINAAYGREVWVRT